MTAEPPALSVVIPTVRGAGPVLGRALASLDEQSRATDTEILIMDGSGRRPPPPGELAPNIRWISLPGTWLARLRDVGLREARGQVVAITEDHCRVAPDWCASILRAHAGAPDAMAIGGSVANGSGRLPVDWASFYVVHAPWLAPMPGGPIEHLDGINVSYRQEGLSMLADDAPPGASGDPDQRLRATGARLLADDRIRVRHDQSLGAPGTMLMHFHGGRSFEGLRRSGTPGARLSRAFRCLVIVGPRLVRRLRTAQGRGQPPLRLARAAPWMLLILWFQAAGEIMGALTGAGSSPRRMY